MEGKYKGIIDTDIGTYWSLLRPGGVMYGEGHGIVKSKENGQTEMATWTGQGIGRFSGPGRISFRGSLFFQTPLINEVAKLSFLNNLVVDSIGVFLFLFISKLTAA
jgi:hypothetical protein